MRPWLTPRCVLLLLLLVGAPVAALAHALIAWVPATVVVARLQRQMACDAAEIEAQWRECRRIQQEMTRLRAIAAEHKEQTAPPCLPERQSHAVCEKLGKTLSDNGIEAEIHGRTKNIYSIHQNNGIKSNKFDRHS